MENRDAYIILNSLSGIGPVRVAQLLTFFGEPRSILAAPEKDLAQVHGIGEHLAGVIHNWEATADLAHELELVQKAGVTILTREDADYPTLLAQIHDPPLCLYVRGETAVCRRLQRSLAIVGSRHTTAYGVSMAQTLAGSAAMAGWAVVSGLARGIDTAAHQAVVNVHGCTLAVLGSGLGRLYPQENLQLARDIVAEGGALVTEFPMQYPPDKRGFPMRNRLISGMTLGTLVVEAGVQSGSLITANQALEQGRQVFAVPGRVDSPQSRGCHALLKDGAKLVETFTDVLEEFEVLPGFADVAPAAAAARAGAVRAVDNNPAADLQLTVLEHKLCTFLEANGESAIDAVIHGVAEPASKVLGALVTLEMRHLVSQLPGKRVVLRAARP